MSEKRRVLLIGATGMVGLSVLQQAVGRNEICLTAIARREVPLPPGARMEMRVSPLEHWAALIGAAQPETVVIALGTTIKAVDGDRAAFRAVDHDLALMAARAAKAAGARQCIAVSSVGAEMSSSNFYLSTKGETEDQLAKLRFDRLDILRPGLLMGRREGPLRPVERFLMIIAPLIDPLLLGSLSKYRSVRASKLAEVIFALAGERMRGRFVHEHDDFRRVLSAARSVRG